jgi:type VI secretion system protein ImpK
VRQGLVAVQDLPDRSIVTVLGGGLFKPGEITISPGDQRLIARIAEALAGAQGQIDVVGHTDNVPIRTLRFPSNWELSRARAASVATLLGPRVAAGRMTVEGRGETEPLVTDDTPQARAQNRRVEIILHVPAGGARDTAPATSTSKS